MPKIEVAERAGVGVDGAARPTEDHVVRLDNAVLLLDGATSPHPDLPSGGWYAGLLSAQLADELSSNPEGDLADLLAKAIAGVAAQHDLRPGNAPSSTVAIVRWTGDRVDGLVLADSPIVAFGRVGSGGTDVVADNRIIELRDRGRLRTGADVRYQRNSPGGFWVAEAVPTAAHRAVRRTWRRTDVDAILLATDGVAVGVDDYRLFDWREVLALAQAKGMTAVLDAVREAEESDPNGTRWPRAKRHDDQALALVTFAGTVV
ncbi:hypothetical protein [Amycolatopsis minnesotensis]|uniref:Protein phosphatase 2C domain-containing protein n=1 Tax=Amycolatopsis minnesotensis TaxID=337894 RepID=A0ABN2S5I5_9PSEU